ncbi:MAG: NAD(P)H-dependent glycerol-3-phosphate dehydrogenase [Dehalococcoidia bacterium]|nr:NAD(P)H-dependent glycerol-3-phosphate dehydrogenase [Dehalococcoidia bacterium]
MDLRDLRARRWRPDLVAPPRQYWSPAGRYRAEVRAETRQPGETFNGVKTEVAIAGATTWGTTLGIHLARKDVRALLLVRDADEARRLALSRSHQRLPGVTLPDNLALSADPSSLAGVGLLIFAVPAQSMRANLRRLAPHIGPATLVAHVAKGLEQESCKRMSEVIGDELGFGRVPGIAAISGPNLAAEIAAGLPATTVVASSDDAAARTVQDVLMSPMFRAYTNPDIIGVELGGSLKNVVALGAGLVDGLQLGNNAKAAYVARGLAEITRLGVTAGADPLTFQGLSGLGDLVATCYSPLSRNRRVGEQLALGRPLDQILAETGGVAEGVATVPAARTLALRNGVEMPITEQAHAVLFEGRPPLDALRRLLEREPRPELWGAAPSNAASQ